MTTTETPQWALPPADLDWLLAYLDDFARDCDVGLLAARVAGLPPAGEPRRLPALYEMVKIDLARSWETGRAIHLETYLAAYPELGGRDSVAVELIEAEIAARLAAGDEIDAGEFARRFPRQAASLDPALFPERDEPTTTAVLVEPDPPVAGVQLAGVSRAEPRRPVLTPAEAAAAAWWFALAALPAAVLLLPFGLFAGFLAGVLVLLVAAATALAASALVRRPTPRDEFTADEREAERWRVGRELLWLPATVAGGVLVLGWLTKGGRLDVAWPGWGLLAVLVGASVGVARLFGSWLSVRLREEPADAPDDTGRPLWLVRLHGAGCVLLALRSWPRFAWQPARRPLLAAWGSCLALFVALGLALPAPKPATTPAADPAYVALDPGLLATPLPQPDPGRTTPPVQTPTPPAQTTAIPPALVGTWLWETSNTIRTVDDAFLITTKHWIVIEANGRFRDKSGTYSSFRDGGGEAERDVSGTVRVQGNTLHFETDAGERWVSTFYVNGGLLRLDGKDFLR